MDPVTLGLVYGGGISSAAGLAQGLLSGAGSWATNYANRQLVRQQMAFQERMSSTAYQRAVGDARAAGLNPALLYQQGGASAPSGASATMENAIGAGVSAYQQARMQGEQMRNLEATRRLTDEERITQLSTQDELAARVRNLDAQTQLAKADVGFRGARSSAAQMVRPMTDLAGQGWSALVNMLRTQARR